jgi:hypothetical protein
LADLLRRVAGARAGVAGASEVEIAALEELVDVRGRVVQEDEPGLNRRVRDRGADIPNLADTLQVSASEYGEVYLLNPSVTTKSGEWEAWHFANFNPGEQRYQCLADLLEDLADRDR